MKYNNALRFGLLCAFFVLLLCKPRLVSELTLGRLGYFVRMVFPALFVSLCVSGMLVTAPITRALYCFPFGVECTVFVLGVLCGFPVGARSACMLYRDGVISKQRAEFLCAFSNVASLPFLVGVVGSTMAGDLSFGVRLAALQAVCALGAAVVVYFVYRPACTAVSFSALRTKTVGVSEAVARGAHTMLELGGMLVFFGVAADLAVRMLGLHGVGEVLLSGAIEFSAGCARALEYGGDAGALLATVVIGCSGFCVCSQVAAVTEGELSLRPYLLAKTVQTALMGAFAVLTNV